MTITPMATPVAPAADGAATAPPSGAGSDPAGQSFAALIAAHLGDLAGAPVDASAPATGAQVAPEAEGEGDGETDALPDPAEGDVPSVPAVLVLATTVVAAPAPPVTPAQGGATDETSAGASDESATAPVETPKLRGRSAESSGRTGVLPDQAAAPAHDDARPGGPKVEDPAAPVALVPVDLDAPAAPADPAEPAPAASPVAAPAPAASQPVVTVAPVAPVVPTTSVTPTPSAPAGLVSNPVLDQVKPTFTKLVSGPEGTHRMMLRLHPADLGEIHLTVRVSGDTVDVTVAARPEARAMLVDGHSELRGLLDSVGRTATHITFRDLPGTGTAVQVVQTGGQQANPDGQPGMTHTPDQGFGRSGHSGGNGHPGAGAADQTVSSPRDGRPGVPAETRPTTTTPRTAGHVRGALDVRM